MSAGFSFGQSAKARSIGYENEKAPTLRGGDGGNQKPVVFDGRGNGTGQIAPTITGDHQNRVSDFTALTYQEVAVTLDASYYKGAGERNGVERTVVCVGNGQLDQANLSPLVGALNCMHDQQAVLCFQNTGHGYWSEKSVGAPIRTPAGGGSMEANVIASDDCRNGTENYDTNGTLQAKENGGQSINYQNTVRCGSFVRRLTPMEAERLQGMPDYWSKYGINEKGEVYELPDSARYRLQGNGIATPFWRWMLKRISAQYERTPTLGSLFDGQGSFPMIWEGINGPGTALWSSEIEKHAVAVAKYHFPEEAE